MTADERLTEVFDRGLRDGVDSLSSVERELFRIQDFIIEYEMNGLSGYFYNRLPDLEAVLAAVAAMRKHGLLELAALLGEAAELFAGYVDPDPPTSWGEVLRRYDPANRLIDLEQRIGRLRGYGITELPIAEPGTADVTMHVKPRRRDDGR